MPLDAVKTAEKSATDLLRGLKVARPSVKERTTDPKEPKESKFKLAFGFKESNRTNFEIMAETYTLGERKSRLGTLLMPMFFDGKGNQATAIILTALTYAEHFNKHSDLEWAEMLENRNLDECYWDSFDEMDKESIRLFCDLIVAYAEREMGQLDWKDAFGKVLPKEKSEAYFVAQLLCDGGINKYGLSCAGLGKNLLNDIADEFGLATPDEAREHFAELEKEKEGQN